MEIEENCQKDIKRHTSKNKTLQDALEKSIGRILENPEFFKPLRKPLENTRRVHVLKSFVLIFEIQGNTVRLLRFAHHDEAYR